MKHRFLFLLAMAVTMGAAMTGFTSCKDELDTGGNKILGKWYYEKNEPGTIGEGDAAVAYAKIILCGEFQKENKGFWSLIYVDKDNHAINPNNNAFWANCAYTLDGNRIAIKLTTSYLPTHQTDWELTYVNNNCLQTTYDDKLIDLHRITTEQDNQYQTWMRELGFGFIDDEAYNINDKDINASNWRDQIGLYVYDGVGTDVKDEKGRTGYTAVYLPWYKGGVVNSNLDPTFCDDITPENGWEWVLNLCGDRSMQNNNFFALYNKYTGILRFFYYMPTSFTSGNDHMWEINMTDNMAQRSVYTYGLPMDLQIKDKSALNQTKANFFVDYITPYVKNLAPDGKITPNSGWWAFDIDMSLYRPDDHTFASGQSVGLQMRSWNEDHVSLTSAIKGALDGKIELDQTHTYTVVSKSKGVFGIIKDVVGVGKAAVATVVSAKSGNVGAAVKNGVGLAKEGYNLYGDLNTKDNSQTVTDTLSNIRGTISFGMDATAETSGTIMTSVPVTGVASPTIPGTKFITAGTGVGDGVWNLKTSPVVYYFNEFGLAGVWGTTWEDKYGLYFFDPSSIEVALNPEIFPENDIEWTEVTALCGTRDVLTEDGTEKYRQAFGLKYNLQRVDNGARYIPNSVLVHHWTSDFLYNCDDKQGTTYIWEKPWFGNRKMNGRGIEGEYYIEPIITNGLPQLEVSVTVVIKLRSKEKPIFLHRLYIPEMKCIILKDQAQMSTVYESIVSKPKVNGKIEMGPLYDYQLQRIYNYKKYLDPLFDCSLIKASDVMKMIITENNYLSEYWKIKWDANVKNASQEWSYDKPQTICAYEITSSGLDDFSWKLMAKENEEDGWTILHEQSDYHHVYLLRHISAQFDIQEKNRPWKVFRLEISKDKEVGFELSNFKLIY